MGQVGQDHPAAVAGGPGGTVEVRTWQQLDIRVGRITSARPAAGARKAAYQLSIDFGPLGTKRSSARITDHYRPEELVGRLVVAVVNLPPRIIAGFTSEVLVLGAVEPDGGVILLQPDRPCEPGLPIA